MGKLKKLSVALMWLPGFAPDDPFVPTVGCTHQQEAVIIDFPRPVAAHGIVEKAVWPPLNEEVYSSLSGVVSKFDANVAAIELLRKLESEKRHPTTEEREILNRYTGWGGIPAAFNAEQTDQAWVARAESLKGLLTEDEHRSAEASTPNAHYTSLEVIKATWAMVQRLGFKGGRILEPSAGVGYFLGAMPQEISKASTVTAVELDRLSARILKSLYGNYGVSVLQQGFEAAQLPEGFYDLAISNVPFGNYQVPELRNVPYANFLIHDYFFAKAMEVIRPGGLVAFITSSGTMDKNDDKVRQYLASKAELVAAVRLPNTAFKSIANTEVTTDILVMQKPENGRKLKNRQAWMKQIQLPDASPVNGEIAGWRGAKTPLHCNQYFAANPDWVIGKLVMTGGMYQNTIGCVFDGNLAEALASRVSRLPEGIYTEQKPQEAVENRKFLLGYNQQGRPGYRVVDGVVCISDDGLEAEKYQAPSKTLERIAGLCGIRNAVRKVIKVQAESDDDAVLNTFRRVLNLNYDAFVAQHGYIHAKANRSAFKDDPDLPLLMSLERWDGETQTAEKADIFFQRTVGLFRRVETADTPEGALQACLAECGRIVESRIGELLGKAGSESMKELEGMGLVFHDPLRGWETKDAYLSGNVRQKLTVARVSGERYSQNVQALEAVIPVDLAPSEIGARIGSTWIPACDYQAFLDEVMECEGNTVSFNQTAAAWHIDQHYSCRWSVPATQTYGTERVNAIVLFSNGLNQTVPTVYDQDPIADKRVVNQKETIAAREKLELLREKFQEWLWADQDRAQRLVRLYNDVFNSVVKREYDGQHLVLPGFSRVYQLHVH